MSYTAIIGFDKDTGDSATVEEFRNATGIAMLIWTVLFDKYIKPGKPENYYIFQHYDAVLDLNKSTTLLSYEHICLLFTFDDCVVLQENAKDLAEALIRFHADAEKAYPDYANHLKAAADCITKSIGEYKAYALYATSVGENPWLVQEKIEDDEGDNHYEERPYNLGKDSGHWSLFNKEGTNAAV